MARVSLCALVAALALAGVAAAQPRDAATPLSTLFISPMGEPFRAQGDQTPVQRWFAETDTDHDGRVSLAEFIANADAFFAKVDSNGDGVVTSTESTALWQAEAPEVLSPVDNSAPITANNNDSVQQHHQARVEEADPTGGLQLPGYDERHRGAAGPRASGAQAYGLLGDIEPVMSCDRDFDRRIIKSEFEQCAQRRFVELDANHDGFFTPDEVHPWLVTARARAEH
jgi:hypothetical protein